MPHPEAADGEVIPKGPEIPEAIVRRIYIRKADVIEVRRDARMHRMQMYCPRQATSAPYPRMTEED